MSNITTLKDIVNDYLQTASPSILSSTLELDGSATDKQELIDKLILQGANNARKWAEKSHDFSWNDVTLAGVIPADQTGLSYKYKAYEFPQPVGVLNINPASSFLQVPEARHMPLGSGVTVCSVDGQFDQLTLPAVYTEGETILVDNAPEFGAPLPEGIYQVYWNNQDTENCRWFRYIKTVESGWVSDKDYAGSFPIRVERKRRLSSRLIENVSKQCSRVVTWNGRRLVTHGERIYTFPGVDEPFYVLLDVNAWSEDYTLGSDSDEFLTHGFEFMQWATIVEVNRLLQRFVARQEGNIAPPNNDRDRALRDLIEFDNAQSGMHDIQID